MRARLSRWLSGIFTPPGAVRVETWPAFASRHLRRSFLQRNTRPIHIYLPDDYTAAPDKHYPVLYANDGQDLRVMKLKETLEALYAANAIQRVIVVAMHATKDRMHEYGTAGAINAHGLGRRAEAYARFVLEEVQPFINAHYRTRIGPAHTALMGWSLGGLSAFDLAWEHPDVFGAVGAFSASFWWRSADGDLAARLASRVAHRKVRAGQKRAGLRFWFEAGTKDETDDRDGNGVIDSIQDTLELMDELRAKGYAEGDALTYVQVESGEHNPATWAKVLPDFLKWAFPLD